MLGFSLTVRAKASFLHQDFMGQHMKRLSCIKILSLHIAYTSTLLSICMHVSRASRLQVSTYIRVCGVLIDSDNAVAATFRQAGHTICSPIDRPRKRISSPREPSTGAKWRISTNHHRTSRTRSATEITNIPVPKTSRKDPRPSSEKSFTVSSVPPIHTRTRLANFFLLRRTEHVQATQPNGMHTPPSPESQGLFDRSTLLPASMKCIQLEAQTKLTYSIASMPS
jgi:hypothetical protein